MTQSTKKKLKILFYILGGLISATMMFFLIYYSKDSFVKIWETVETKYLVLSGVSAFLIYASMGMALWEVLRVMKRRISPFAAIGISLVSTTINYLISSLGVSGFALRAHMLDRRKVPLGICVTASIVITVLLYFVLVLIILQGSVLLAFQAHASRPQIIQSLALIAFMSAFCVVITLFFFNNEFRVKWIRKGFRLINRVTYHLFTALIPKAVFDSFSDQLEKGINAIQKKRKRLPRAIAYICADWAFTMLVLYFAFKAVGVSISPVALISGFAVGMMTTLIPILPGGLGAMELAMTAVYSQFGIDWDSALMACLIYRVLYYIIPGIVSIPVYWALQFTSRSKPRHENTAG